MMIWSDFLLKNLPQVNTGRSSHNNDSTVMILAGEPSGDLHAADLIRQMKGLNPQLNFVGMGGPKMKRAGAKLFFSIDQLSAMGFVEVLCQFKQIQQAFRGFRQALKYYRPVLLILVDYPGFNLRAAGYAKKYYSIPVLYYIAPKVWAWNKGRIVTIRKFVDHVALIFPFETALYKRAKISATYVGNPLIDHLPAIRLRPENKSRLSIGLLPGSRPGEVRMLLDIMLKAGSIIKEKYHDCRFIISCADSISEQFLNNSLASYRESLELEIVYGAPDSIFEKSHLLIAASGTITLEAALRKVPCILIYKVSPVSYHIARHLVTVKYAGLANLIANELVMPELLQEDANPEDIANIAKNMINDLLGCEKRLKKIRYILGESGAAKRAACIGLGLIKKTGREI